MKKILISLFIFGSVLASYAQTALPKGTASGTNSYSVTISGGPATLADGIQIIVKFTNANTSTATLRLNTLAAKAIKLNGAALASGDLPANVYMLLTYNASATSWQVSKPGPSSGVSTFTVVAGANITVTSGVNTATVSAAPADITVGSTAINSGTSGAIPFNNAGVYGEDATKLFWDDADNFLGIGTNSPLYDLDIQGSAAGAVGESIKNTNTGGVENISLSEGGSDYSFLQRYNSNYGTAALRRALDIYTFDAGDIRFGTTNTERMRILSTGNVGIGTATPSCPLQVKVITYSSPLNANIRMTSEHPGISFDNNSSGGNRRNFAFLNEYNSSGVFEFLYGTAADAEPGQTGWNWDALNSRMQINPSFGYIAGGTGNDLQVNGSVAIGSSSFIANNAPSEGLIVGGAVSIGLATNSASLHIKGSGATSATYSMKVQNSASTDLFNVRDDGNIGFGLATPLTTAHIYATYSSPLNSGVRIQSANGTNAGLSFNNASGRNFAFMNGYNSANFMELLYNSASGANEPTSTLISFDAPRGLTGFAITADTMAALTTTTKVLVNGNMVVGNAFLSGTINAPTDGLAVYGNTGIGVSSATAKLHVVNTTTTQPTFQAVGSNTVTIDYNGIGDIVYPHAQYTNTVTYTYTSTTEAKAITFPVRDDSLGFYVVGDSLYYARYPGVYEIVVTAPCNMTTGSGGIIDMWLNVNGSIIANSNHTITTNSTLTIATVVFHTARLNAGEYFKISTHADDVRCQLVYTAAGVTPTRPAAPSAQLNVVKVSKL